MYKFLFGVLCLALDCGVGFCADNSHLPPAKQLADEASEFFAQANSLSLSDMDRADGLYEQAILRYRSLIEDYGLGNVYTYYNLGNAYLMKSDIGRAILNYRRAQRFDADNADLRNNLLLARARQLDGIAAPTRSRVYKTLFFWHYDLGYSTRLVFTAVCWVAFWLAAIKLLMCRKGRRFTLVVLIISGSLVLCFGVSAALDLWHAERNKEGVITAVSVIAKQGDGENYAASFNEPLHSGAEFVILEQRRNWMKIKLANGSIAWIPARSAEII